jgi:catechol 2,3-dioxygenase-like lactoylglutathione lyase family enzyme
VSALRHIAICTKDPRGTADFYERMFGLKVVDVQETEEGTFVFCSDGVMSLALLDYKTDAAARSVHIDGADFVGIHHIGFLDDDPEGKVELVRQQGGAVIERPAVENDEEPTPYFEYKVLDPNGVVVDVSRKWPGIRDVRDM